MRELEVFNYEGNKVTFKTENGEVMVNATEMAKPFGKKVNDWLRLNSTKEYLQVLENQCYGNSRNIDNQLVKIIQGNPASGIKQGTWFHEDVALEFARWLSPLFAIWCNDQIKKILTNGFNTSPIHFEDLDKNLVTRQGVKKLLKAVDDALAREEEAERLRKEEERNKIIALKRRKEERERRLKAEVDKEIFEKRNEHHTKLINEYQPKAKYADDVLNANNLFSTTAIAKEHGMSAQRLNMILHKAGIQYKQGGRWYLYAKYQNKGYTSPKTYKINADGEIDMFRTSTYWTEAGRYFIYKVIQKLRRSEIARNKIGIEKV